MFNLLALLEAAGYVGLVGIIFAESGLFFGFFLPGDSLLFTAGFLASRGFFSLPMLLSLVVVAAVAGDSVGYWFGNKIGPMIFIRPDSFWFSHARVEQARLFFERKGGMSILLARFIPAVRTFTPIIAGVANMRYAKFLAYNVIGGTLWGVGMTLLGFFLGNAIPGIDNYIIVFAVLIALVSFLPIVWEIVHTKKK